MWCPCVGRDECLGLFLSLPIPWQTKWPVQRCSQNEWPGPCLPMTTSCLPTALILHRGHWSGSYWFFLFLPFLLFSFSSSLYLSLSLSPCLSDLSALAKKIKLEAMASYHSNQQHGGPNGENGDHNPGLGESHPFVRLHTHTPKFQACEMFNHGLITCCTVVACAHLPCRVKQLEQLCLCAPAEPSWLKPGYDITSAARSISSKRWWMKTKHESVLQMKLEIDIWVR